MKATRWLAAVCGLACATPALALDPDKIDWSKIPVKEVALFHPGQSAWEWMIGDEHKAGAVGVRDGKPCGACHAGEEADMGALLVSGKRLEPAPIPGRSGKTVVAVQAAFDADTLYLRARWTDDGKAGVFYPGNVFKDGKWEPFGNHRGVAAVAKGTQPPVYEDRLSFMIGDPAKVPEFAAAGCWATCHNDMRFMPNAPGAADVKAHPVLGDAGQKRSDIRKYLAATRTSLDATGGWKNPKAAAEVDALKLRGYVLDLLQWRGHRTNPVGVGDDGYVLDYRLFDAGKNAFRANWDPAKKQPLFMLDPAKAGGRATLTPYEIVDPKAPTVLTDDLRVPFDPAVAAKEGAVLPQWYVTKPEGSAADVDFAKGTHDGKGWTVVMRRKLATGNPDDVALVAGGTYTLGVAVHDDMVTARWHHVSFPLTFSLGTGKGDVDAVALR